MLLERLLEQLPAPLPAQGQEPLLLDTLAELAERLAAPGDQGGRQGSGRQAQRWLDHAIDLGLSRPLLLAIGQQGEALDQLLRGRTLINGAIQQLAACRP